MISSKLFSTDDDAPPFTYDLWRKAVQVLAICIFILPFGFVDRARNLVVSSFYLVSGSLLPWHYFHILRVLFFREVESSSLSRELNPSRGTL